MAIDPIKKAAEIKGKLASGELTQEQVNTAKANITQPVAQPIAKIDPIKQEADAAKIAVADDFRPEETKPSTMEVIKQSDRFKDLLAKGFTEAQIEEAVSSFKPPEVAKPAVVPQAETVTKTVETPTAEVQVEAEKKPAEAPKADGITPLAPLELSEYQDDSSARQNDIVNNLNQYRQSSPQFMKDIDTFRQTFSYGLRSDQQKSLLDNWYTGYVKGVELSNMSNGDLSTMYSSGNLSDNDLENLKLNDPAKYQEVMGDIDANKELAKYKDELYGKEEDPVVKGATLTKPITKDLAFFDEYEKAINSEEVKVLNDDMQDKETEMDKLDQDLQNIDSEIRKTYEGTGASESKINRIVYDAQADTQRQKNRLGLEYNNSLGKYNNIVNAAKDKYTMDLQKYEIERDNAITQYGMDKDKFDKQRQLTLRGMDKEDAQEAAMLNLYEQLDVSKMTEGQIDEIDAPAFMKDYLNFKKDLGISNEASYTMEKDGKTYFLDKYGNPINTFDMDTADIQMNMDITRNNPNNVAKDVNNPGNITVDGFSTKEGKANYAKQYGAVGTYTSPNGREYLVFNNEEDGARALRQYVAEKASGQSGWAKPTMTIGQFLTGYVQGPNSAAYKNSPNAILNTAYGQAVMNSIESGNAGEVSPNSNTRIGNIDPNSIADGIAKAEGYGDVSNLGYSTPTDGVTDLGENSKSILEQTGLDTLEFDYITKGTAALARLSEPQRLKIIASATDFLNKNDIDLSTFKSRYSALNESLERTTRIMGNIQRDEIEIQGTLDNLTEVSVGEDLSDIKRKVMFDYFAGKEVNDPKMVEYGFFISQLKEEIAGYNAALKGNTQATIADTVAAEEIVYNGLSSGGVEGLKSAMEKSIFKLATNLPIVVDSVNKQVRDLFGVGDNFQGKTHTTQEEPKQEQDVDALDDYINNINGFSYDGVIDNNTD